MPGVAAQLDERARLAGVAVSDDLKAKLLAYYELLLHWNRKINLTALDEPERAIDRLLLEPLAASAHLPRQPHLLDLGSGGGSPAVPLALALDAPWLAMVESRARKSAFLREVLRELQLNGVVETMRFQELTGRRGYSRGFDLVSMRAVRPDAAALATARESVRDDGVIAVFTSAGNMLGAPMLGERSTWNILGSAMLVTFHVKHSK